MRGFLWTFVVCLSALVASPAVAQDVAPVQVELTLPETVVGKVNEFIRIDAKTNGKTVEWFAVTDGLNVFPSELLRDSKSTVVTVNAEGTYKLVAYTAVGDVLSKPKTCIVQVGKPQPTPPAPGPTPPEPKPDVVPIAEKGLRVLVIYNDSDLTKAENKKYLNVINSSKIAGYCAQNCVQVNGVPEVRFVDDDETFAHESKIWQDAIKRPRTSKFWFLVSNGDAGEEGPLPDNEDALIAIFGKYKVK